MRLELKDEAERKTVNERRSTLGGVKAKPGESLLPNVKDWSVFFQNSSNL